MNKLVTTILGVIATGLFSAHAAPNDVAAINAERDTRIGKIRSVTAESPLSFSQSHRSNHQMVQWHSSHYSHSSHSSHSSHYSHRSGY